MFFLLLTKDMRKYILPVLSVVAALAIVFFVMKKKQRESHVAFLQSMGFGDGYLEGIPTDILSAVHTYVVDYTRRGIKVTEGTALDKKLLIASNKYNLINYI